MLGGTGHIGATIARRLSQDGWVVTASGRRPGPRPNLDGTPVEIVSGPNPDAGQLQDWIRGSDLVVDAATPYPLWLHEGARTQIVADAVARTRTLTAQTAGAGAAFVHISSFTTLPRPEHPLGQLSTGVLQGMHSYFDLKAKVEAAVLEALDAGLVGCVINPATCFGPYDLKPREHTFIPMLLAGKVGGLVRHDMNVVDTRDVAAVVAGAWAAHFQTRRVPVFGHNITLPDLARAICHLGGVSPPRVQVPSLVGMAGLLWLETACAALGQKPPWPSLPILLVRASYAAPPSAAQLRLAGHPRALADTLADAVNWYRQIGRA